MLLLIAVYSTEIDRKRDRDGGDNRLRFSFYKNLLINIIY